MGGGCVSTFSRIKGHEIEVGRITNFKTRKKFERKGLKISL